MARLPSLDELRWAVAVCALLDETHEETSRAADTIAAVMNATGPDADRAVRELATAMDELDDLATRCRSGSLAQIGEGSTILH